MGSKENLPEPLFYLAPKKKKKKEMFWIQIRRKDKARLTIHKPSLGSCKVTKNRCKILRIELKEKKKFEFPKE